jgi:hypothetical protein
MSIDTTAPVDGELWELLRAHAVVYAAWNACRGLVNGDGESWERARRRMRAAWDIGLCAPGGRMGERSGDIEAHIDAIRTPFCAATVVQREAVDDAEEAARGGHLLYRGACLGCGWVSGVEHSIGAGGENAAVEDALDHSHAGWRELPVFPPLPAEGPGRDRRLADQRARLARLCPPGWAETGGPTKSARCPMGTRHVPERGWFGGYDLGVLVGVEPVVEAVEQAQLPLFA